MGKISLVGRPNPRQIEFFNSVARHICYGGARGGGKSWAMRRKFVLLALKYPGLRLLLMRRTMPELLENHLLPLQKELYGYAKYRDKDKAFIFPNGSRLKLGYCDIESDVFQYQGQEHDVIGLEEATLFTESQKDFLTTCNRSTRSDFHPRMYYTCNPGNVGHAWVKRLFIDREYRNRERAEDYIFIPAKVWDNTVLMENNPEYVESLMNLPDELRKAHLDGDWDVFAGQFFSEFRRDVHTCNAFTIPSYWSRFVSIDWGYNDPCCVLWYACDLEGKVFVYRELYVSQMLSTDVARKIKELQGDEEIDYYVGSPDMWQKRGQDHIIGENIAEVFWKLGIGWTKADSDRINGWNRIHEFLRKGADGEPQLKIFTNCANLIRSLPQLIHDDKKVEDVALEPHEVTNAPDSLRYGLMSRPRPGQRVSVKKDYIPFALKTDEEEYSSVY